MALAATSDMCWPYAEDHRNLFSYLKLRSLCPALRVTLLLHATELPARAAPSGRQAILALPLPCGLSTCSCHAACRQRARKRRSPPPAADSAAELLRAEMQEARLAAVLEEQRLREMQASNHEHAAARPC